MNKLAKVIIIILGLAILLTIGVIIYFKVNEEQIYFALYGNDEITIYEGETYKELGFVAKDKKDNNLQNRVVIKSDLNNNMVGNYTISYSLETKFKTLILTRNVKVLRDPFKSIDFSLNGGNIVNINLNEEYKDSLFKCLNKETNQELNSLVKIENNVNNQVIGTYEIKYHLMLDNKLKTLTRTVNVLEKKYDQILSTEKKTNEDITINFISNIPNFSYIIMPDNTKTKENNVSFKVNENGTYKFIIYDNENKFEESIVEITNIDKIPPKITACSGIVKNNQTIFTINTNDTDISKYLINNQEINKNNLTINQNIDDATLTVYDEANNIASIKCYTQYQEINPKGHETLIRSSNTDTLKVWIEKTKRNDRTFYYTTHIWVRDAYNQFKAHVPPNFSNELLIAKDLLNSAISVNNFNSKLVIAVNASGFVQKGTFGQSFYNANPDWDLTGGCPLVIVNGKILRDFSNKTFPPSNYLTYGLKKDGYLEYYKYKAGTNLPDNIDLSKKIINDGVLNTFSFHPILVYNGVKKSTDTEQNIRQGFCQIDKNNFVFITDEFTSSRNGFSFSELADYMLSLGCKFGFNLDGGGSTSLIYKDKNKTSEIISGSTRKIADIVYFHE